MMMMKIIIMMVMMKMISMMMMMMMHPPGASCARSSSSRLRPSFPASGWSSFSVACAIGSPSLSKMLTCHHHHHHHHSHNHDSDRGGTFVPGTYPSPSATAIILLTWFPPCFLWMRIMSEVNGLTLCVNILLTLC